MKLSLNWLKQYVKFKQTPEKLAEILTLAGIEVERIEKLGRGLENVVVGQIKTIVGHSGANNLVVCKVNVGKSRNLNIVCGAKNIKLMDKVPVALVGAVLPNGVKIEARKIRGINSEGMLCAEDELGLGDDHAGILILDSNLRIGQNFGKAIGLNDIVFDLSLPPNRADWYSVLGIARELAALTKQKLDVKRYATKESKERSIKKHLSVKIQDYDLCPKYVAKVVKNVKIKESPAWLKSRLLAYGVKPINNVVDISNYVMIEMGQPLHIFDYHKVGGKKIIVRRAKKGEKIKTLDNQERNLDSQILVIADNKNPIAVAGVMGGFDSEVTKKTKDIIIESAIFKPLSIRKTRQKLGLVTEASTRFEKGIWSDLPASAAERAAAMISQLADGEVIKDRIIKAKKEYKPQMIKVSLDYVNKLIGIEFGLNQAKRILESLKFKVEVSKDQILNVTVPSWRQDVKIPAEVAEEVGRLYGWNKLKPTAIYSELKPPKINEEKKPELPQEGNKPEDPKEPSQ